MAFICRQCPRRCGVRRDETGAGFCRMGERARVARIALHFDEEPCLSGTRGSGAVFFSGCALRCVFCQNFQISAENFGRDIDTETLRARCEGLVAQGAHNINFVNPTHFAHVIGELLERPFGVPTVWNSGGYDSVPTLRAMEGKISVYLPDLKYVSADKAARYAGAPDYFAVAQKAILEMARQAGEAQFDENGIMTRGLLIRHLLLPGGAADAIEALKWIAANTPNAYVSLMAQYLPCGQAAQYPEIDRQITQGEYDRVVEVLFRLGLENGYVQELSAADEGYIPPFDLTGVP